MANRFFFIDDNKSVLKINEAGDALIIRTAEDAPSGLPTHHRSTGLSVLVSDPLLKTNRTSYGRLSDQIESYSHDIRAFGGFQSARMRINNSQNNIEDWIDRGGATGLGRHIVVYNPAGVIIWEGFVNKINVALGGFSYSLGPFMEISNRVTVVYSTIDTSTTPPTSGVRTRTTPVNDTDSQALYGIIEKIVSTGGAIDTEATRAGDSWLEERANPLTNSRDNVSGDAGPSLSLDCLGYWHWFKLYVYNQVATSGDINLSQKIEDVINAQLNSIFSTDFKDIATNTFQVPDYDDKDRKVETILKQLQQLGDSSGNRYNIGVYADRKVIYEPAPTIHELQRRLTGNEGITDRLSAEIDPWDVVAAKWIFYPDFLSGRIPPVTAATLRTDPRTTYIESVKFTAPWQVSITGDKTGELDQIMAQLGFKGQSS